MLCFAIALCFAEMAALVPANGAACAYAREAFGPFPGFLVGWVMWLSALVGGASVAVAFGSLAVEPLQAAAAMAGLGPLPPGALALGASTILILALAAANSRGATQGAASNNLLAMLKLVPLAAFTLWALPRVRLDALAGPVTASPEPLAGFLLVLYTFSGFEDVPVPAGETRDAGRNVPRALALVLTLAAVLYAVIQAEIGSMGLAGSETPLSGAARGHGMMASLIGAGALASVASVNAAIVFTGPRSLWVLAADGWVPAWLAALHPATGVPLACLVVTTGLTLALVWSGTFEALAVLAVLASLLQYLAAILAVIWLRWREPDRPRPVRIPGGLLIPAAALLVCLLLLVTSELQFLAGSAAAIALGAILAVPRLRSRAGA